MKNRQNVLAFCKQLASEWDLENLGRGQAETLTTIAVQNFVSYGISNALVEIKQNNFQFHFGYPLNGCVLAFLGIFETCSGSKALPPVLYKTICT
jgi:hypothetical protein